MSKLNIEHKVVSIGMQVVQCMRGGDSRCRLSGTRRTPTAETSVCPEGRGVEGGSCV